MLSTMKSYCHIPAERFDRHGIILQAPAARLEDMDGLLANTASLLSDRARASILLSLLDGTALPAGQLAILAHVAPQTASSHLSKLVRGRLLAVEQQRRHRYYRIANIHVADAIEALLTITPHLKRSGAPPDAPLRALDYARTCYSHLAGRLAVEIADALRKRDFLRAGAAKQYKVTRAGRDWFQQLGVPITEVQAKRARFARQCLDWTERRHHIAGELGSAMLRRFQELKWIVPARETRGVRVTQEGELRLWELLVIQVKRC